MLNNAHKIQIKWTIVAESRGIFYPSVPINHPVNNLVIYNQNIYEMPPEIFKKCEFMAIFSLFTHATPVGLLDGGGKNLERHQNKFMLVNDDCSIYH